MFIRYRSIAACLVLSIITCGLYGIFWFITLTDDSNAVSGQPGTSGVAALLLTLVTCGLYYFYWCWRLGEKLDCAREYNGAARASLGLVFVLLSIFGLGIISQALAQNEINKYASA